MEPTVGSASSVTSARSDVAVPHEGVGHALQHGRVGLVGVEDLHHEEGGDVAKQQEVQDVGKRGNSIVLERKYRCYDVLEEVEAHQEGEERQDCGLCNFGLYLHGSRVLLARREDGPNRRYEGQDLRIFRCGAQNLQGELPAEGLSQMEPPSDQLGGDGGRDGKHQDDADVLDILRAQQGNVADDQGRGTAEEANHILKIEVEDARVPEESEAEEEEADVHEQHPPAKGAQQADWIRARGDHCINVGERDHGSQNQGQERPQVQPVRGHVFVQDEDAGDKQEHAWQEYGILAQLRLQAP
mmetsp:Transcript_34480/g.93449  ORF Transcript_34480/g.93449 Transcript_34480/m.93449 type:complete len:299 (+) Transcript_34480:76-972(+)